jgi:hypothetical protein
LGDEIKAWEFATPATADDLRPHGAGRRGGRIADYVKKVPAKKYLLVAASPAASPAARESEPEKDLRAVGLHPNDGQRGKRGGGERPQKIKAEADDEKHTKISGQV